MANGLNTSGPGDKGKESDKALTSLLDTYFPVDGSPKETKKEPAQDAPSWVEGTGLTKDQLLGFEPIEKPKPKPSAKEDYGATSVDEGLESGWKGLASGLSYAGGQALDWLGADEIGKDWKEFAREYRASAPKSDGSVGFFMGSLVPSVVPTALAIGAAPFTGGSSLLAAGSMGALSLSSAGSGMMEYEAYKQSKGEEVSPWAKLGVGTAYAVAEAVMERFQLGKLMPKGFAGKFLKGGVKEAEEAGVELLERFAKKYPSRSKELFKRVRQGMGTEGLEEVATEIAQTGTELFYKEGEDRTEAIKDLPSNLFMAFAGGSLMGGALGPLSYAAQEKVHRERRKERGKVTIAESLEDGKTYELITPIKNEQFEGYKALSPEGEEVTLSREEVGQHVTFSTAQFDKLLQDKLDRQQFELAHREPKLIGKYQGQDVQIKPDGEGGYYVLDAGEDGGDKHVTASEVTDIEEISPEEQMTAEGNPPVDQPVGPVEVIREQAEQNDKKPGILWTEDGDAIYPDQEGYDELLDQQQEQGTDELGVPKEKTIEPRQFTVGKGKNAQNVTLLEQDDGSYKVGGRRVVQNGEVIAQPIEEMPTQEVTELKKEVEKTFNQRGNYEVVTELSDPNDDLSPLTMRVRKVDAEEQAQQERQNTLDENYEIQAEGNQLSVVNVETNEEVGTQSPYYLPKVQQYFEQNKEAISNLPRATDNNPDVTEENFLQEVANYSENPVELSEAYLMAQEQSELNNQTDHVQMAIAHGIGKGSIHPDEIAEYSDSNRLEGSQGIIYANYTSRSAKRDLDVQAEIISRETGQEVTPLDIIDFMVEHPNGPKQYLNKEDEVVGEIKQRFKEVTGIELSAGLAETITGANEQTSETTDDSEALFSEEDIARMDEELSEINNQIEETKDELKDQGLNDEEIQAVEQAADSRSEEEIESLESEVQALENEQEELSEEELDRRVEEFGAFFEQQAGSADEADLVDITDDSREGAEAQSTDEVSADDSDTQPAEQEITGEEGSVEDTGDSGDSNTFFTEEIKDSTSRAQELKGKEEKAKEDLSKLFDEFDDIAGGQANMGLDPKLIQLSGKIIAKGTELGFIKFKQFADFVINQKGVDFWKRIFDNFRAAYSGSVMMDGNPNNEDLNTLSKASAEDYISDEIENKPSEITDSELSQPTEETNEELKEETTGVSAEAETAESGGAVAESEFQKPKGRPQYTAAAYEAVSSLPEFEQFEPGYFRKYEGREGIDDLAIEGQPLPENWKEYDDPDAYMLIIEQSFVQEGDLMSDPRIDVAVYPNLNMIIPLTYTNSSVGSYQEVYRNGEPNTRLRNELASFIPDWIKNFEALGLFDESEKLKYEGLGVEGFVEEIQEHIKGSEPLNKTQLENIAKDYGITKANEAKELAELAVVRSGRAIVREGGSRQEIYDKIVELYENQPNMTHRTSGTVAKQQYSTPVPISFLGGAYTNLDDGVAGFEPSAGNGMMTVAAANPDNIIANEIDQVRLENLNAQGFFDVTEQDGTQIFERLEGTQQALVTNPPFGGLDEKTGIEARGQLGTFGITKLEHLMAIRGLNTLRDDGKAAIVIGGNNKYSGKGLLKGADKVFFNYLYNQYNVDDVINISGDLYRRQGANFPIRLILIDGRKAAPEGFAPLRKDHNNDIVESFDELYNRVNPQITKPNHAPILQSELVSRGGASDAVSVQGESSEENQPLERPATESGERLVATDRASEQPEPPRQPSLFLEDDRGLSGGRPDSESGAQPEQPTAGETAAGSTGLPATDQPVEAEDRPADVQSQRPSQRPTGRDLQRTKSSVDSGVTVNDILEDAGGNVVYAPLSDNYSLETEMPASMAFPMIRSLNSLADKHGNIDEFVREKLQYDSVDELFEKLSAEQIDAVALGIDQIDSGAGMIIGDQTGIGKGRVGAALVRYSTLQGKTPIFITEKKKLFSDLFRDLNDIDSGELRPFIMNNDGKVTDDEGKVIHKALSRNKQKQFLESGDISDYDFILTTYSQVASSRDTKKKQFLSGKAGGNVIVMDESHNASGESNTGEFIMDMLKQAQGATYLSATFAKRADNFPVYAMKTAISDVSMTTEDMIEAIQSGGVALQEILSADLVKAGQMIRRQRNFEGVEVNYEMLGVDEQGNLNAQGQAHRQTYDTVAEIIREIIGFQERHIKPIIKQMDKELTGQSGAAAIKKGTDKSGVDNMPFVSKVHMVIDQLLFSLKAEDVASATIEILEQDKKPVIAFKNTMESFFKDRGYGPGDKMESTSFALTLERALDGVMRYTVTDYKGDDTHHRLTADDLGTIGRRDYERLAEKIRTSSEGISLSPLDVIINRVEDAGYSVGEVTGRDIQLDINEDGSALIKKKELKDADEIFRGFNGGDIDVLMLNASGATGASAHASEKFADQRQREMIIHQPELNINTEVQKRGRINRTGQVVKPAYRYITSAIPAESRLMMVLKNKLKSLDANTTSNQKTSNKLLEFDDFINQYGDEIVTKYLLEHKDLNQDLLDPIEAAKKESDDFVYDGAARRVTGRIAFMPSKVQEEFYNEIGQRYKDYIDYLDQIGENELTIESLDLKAKTLDRKVVVLGENTGSPFGADTILERVEANVLRKPYKIDEIENIVAEELDGRSGSEYTEQMLEDLNAYHQRRLEAERERINQRFDEKLGKVNDQMEEEAEQAEGDYDYAVRREEITQSIEDERAGSLERMDGRLEIQKEYVEKKLFKGFTPGDLYIVPQDEKGTAIGRSSNAVFIGFDINESRNNPYAPSAVKLRFATSDGRRYISVPGSVSGFIHATQSNTDMVSNANRKKLKAEWDQKMNHNDREKRHVATGNILQALNKYGTTGQLVSYTTGDGSIKNGLLMPQDFDPADTKKGGSNTITAPFNRAYEHLTDTGKVESSNEEVVIARQGNEYELRVPGSKRRGGKYFLDESLQGLVKGGEFDKYGGTFNGKVSQDNLKAVMDYLHSEFGLTAELPRSAVENREALDDTRFSRRDELSSNFKPFNQAIENYWDGSIDPYTILNLGKPSIKLKDFGVPDVPIVITQGIIKKATRGKHDVSKAVINNLPAIVKRPILKFNHPDPNRKALLTPIRKDDKTILVAIELNTEQSGIEVVDIRSVYGKDNSEIFDWIENGRLEYADKEKALQWLDGLSGSNSPRPVFATEKLLSKIRNIIKTSNFDTRFKKNPSDFLNSQAEYIRDRIEQKIQNFAARDLIEVAAHPNDLPAGLQHRLEQETERIGGVFYRGRSYILAYNLTSVEEAMKVHAHESIGHLGIRGLIAHESSNQEEFQARFNTLTNEVYQSFKEDEQFKEIAKQYGYDMRKTSHRQQAAEEFIAHLAEEGTHKSTVDKFVTLINDLLKSLGIKKGITKADIRSMLADARQFIEEGPVVYEEGSLRPAFSIFNMMENYEPNEGEPNFRVLAWHGSPHAFNKFSTEHIGSGEGAQAFGWGLYFTEKEDIAKWYAEKMGTNFDLLVDGERINAPVSMDGDFANSQYVSDLVKYYTTKEGLDTVGALKKIFDTQDNIIDEKLNEGYLSNSKLISDAKKTKHIVYDLLEKVDKGQKIDIVPQRNLYKVFIHDGKEPSEYNWLDWDGNINKERYGEIKQDLLRDADKGMFSEEQTYRLNDNLGLIDRNIDSSNFYLKGESIYRLLHRVLGSQKAASQWLLKRGIDGIRYPANQGNSEGNNYVVFDENVVTIDDHIRYKRLGTVEDSKHEYQRRQDNLLRKYQDRFIDGKRIIKGVVEAGGTVTDENNFYEDESLHYGRVEKQQQILQKEHEEPLIKEINRLYKDKGITYEDVRKYLYARHAPERNAQLFRENPEKGRKQSGMSDAEASKIIRAFHKKGWGADLRRIGKMVDGVTALILDKRLESGLISQGRYDTLKKMYDYYVPLRGFEEHLGTDPTVFSGDMSAEGRESKAGDILAYLFAMADTSIISGEKNKVKQSLLRFVEDNYGRTDLFRIKNVYYRPTGDIDPETGKEQWIPTHHKPTTQELLDGTVKKHLDYDKEQALWDGTGSPFDESSLRVLVDGRPVVLEFTKPHIAAAFKGLGVPDLPGLVTGVNKWMQYLRHTITQYSPEFGPRNMFRDSFTGSINLSIDFDTFTAGRVVNPYTISKGFGALRKAFRKNDYSGAWGQAVKDFEDYGSMSGYWELDQVQQRTRDLQAAVEDGGISENPMYTTKKGLKKLGQWFDDYNRVLENVIRLSTFKHLTENKVINKDTGKPYTKKQAASYAKNLTVNFNRKGTQNNWVGSLFLFYNAAVQGIARQAQPFFSDNTRTRWRAAAMPMVMASGAVMAIEAMRISLGKDEDDEWYYDKINDWTRTHNIILPNFATDDPTDYIKIPLPYGYNVYWAAGDVADRLARGVVDLTDAAMEMAITTADAYNPIGTASGDSFGSGTYKTFLPTIFKPGFELVYNKNFAGSPIKPEPFPFAPEEPNSQQYWPWVSTWAKDTALWLNTITGGDRVTSGLIDVSPEHLEYLVGYFGGGSARFLTGLINTGTNIYDHITGQDQLEKYDIYDVPFARSYYGTITDSATRKAFYENDQTISNLVDDYERYYELGKPEKAQAFYEEHKALILLEPQLKAIRSQMRSLKKLQDLYEQDNTEAARKQVDQIDQSIHELHLEFNRMVNEAEKSKKRNPSEFLNNN